MQRAERENKNKLELFGGSGRTRFLIGVAVYGPVAGRELGRRVCIDSSQLPGFRRRFVRDDILTEQSGHLLLNERFFAHDELAILLNALAGRRLVVLPDALQRKPLLPRRFALFGTSGRTRMLTALAELGSTTISECAFVARVNSRSALSMIAAFKKMRVVRTERTNRGTIATLDERPALQKPLRALLLKLGKADAQMHRLAAISRSRVQLCKADHEISERTPLPFGTPGQARALVVVAYSGAMTTPRLARSIGATRNATRGILEGLIGHGLIVASVVGSGRACRRWVTLNDAHPIAAPIRRYVLATTERPPFVLEELPPRQLRRTAPVRKRTLPGPRLRIETYVAVSAAGELSVAEVARKLGVPGHAAVRRWAADLHRCGLIQYGLHEGRPTLRAISGPPTLSDLGKALAAFAEGT